MPVGEYNASGVETATNIVGPDGWRERMVPNWGPNGSDYYGPSATDDFFAFDPQDSVAERIRLDFSTNSGNYDGGAYLYDESAYNAWGERLLDYSPLGTSNSASGAQQIGQTDTAGYEAQFGYQTDTATGLLLAGHRFYQPQTRRWLNRDPTGYAGGLNLYEYADNDPVNEGDPSGDSPSIPWWLTKAGWGRALHRFFLGGDTPGQPVLGQADHSGEVDDDDTAIEAPLIRNPQQSVAAANAQARATVGGFLGSIVPIPSAAAEEEATERAVIAADASRVASQSSSTWTSPAGLIYGTGSADTNRVLHVFAHLAEDPSKPTHSVFNVGSSGELLDLIDEAWTKRGNHEAGDAGAYVIDLGRVIGTRGETKIRIIVRPGTSKLVTAYPWR